ncbi:hypothetical protein V1504DRAFT_331965 [Lipomyces starkeyi]
MPDSPPEPGSSAPLPSQPCSKPATYLDFVNPLLWVLFTNLAFSLAPSILGDINADDQVPILVFGGLLFLMSKVAEVITVATLLGRSPSLSGRTVTTTTLLAALVGLLAPMFMLDFTLFARFTFMLWSVTLGAFFGICLAFGLGRSEFNNKKDNKGLNEYLLDEIV